MSAQKNEPRRPRLRVVVFLGALSAMLGVTLGFVSLATQAPVEVRSVLRDEDRVAGEVYFLKGNASPSAAWRGARSHLARGLPGTVRISEPDLNAWAKNVFTASQERGGGGDEASPAGKTGILGLEVKIVSINFRLVEDRLQMAAEFSLPGLTGGRSFVYQAMGRLEVKPGGGIAFTPESGYLGKAAIVSLPILGKIIHGRMVASFHTSPEAEELAPGLGKVTAVQLEPGLLTLQLP